MQCLLPEPHSHLSAWNSKHYCTTLQSFRLGTSVRQCRVSVGRSFVLRGGPTPSQAISLRIKEANGS